MTLDAPTDFSQALVAEQGREHFFRLSHELLCISGFDGRITMVNPSWTRCLGWSSAELLSKSWIDLVHPDDLESTNASAERLTTGQSVIDFTNRCLCKDGTYRWLEWRSAPQVEDAVAYSIVRDISATRSTRDGLTELCESLTTTLNSIGDGVIAMELTGAVLRMNPVAENLTGWTQGEARGRSLADILPLFSGDTHAKVESPFDHMLREGKSVALARHTMLARRDGTELPIADTCAPIRGAGGIINGAVLVFRDLTAQRDAEVIQAKFQQQLVFADRMASIGTLAAGVAHEINNPLSYVTANVDLAIEEIRELSGGSSSGRMRELEEMLMDAREGIARIVKIVRGLKTFSRIEEERPHVIDLVPVIDLAVNMAFNEIRHRARLVRDFGKLPLVDGDDARLGQVFINLLVNAAHAFPEGNMDANEIRIVTSTDTSGLAVVEVCDTGPGIPAALLTRIFDPFFTTKPMGVGTGLGLAISHNIITGMGGEISVKSELGHGTTFRVTLPASRALEPTAPSALPRAVEAHHARILVVDDEPSVGLVISRILRRHDVVVVTTARDALDVLAAGNTFDVVLTDLMMPGMSGMELYRAMVRLYPTMESKVVFVTGGAFTGEANAFLDGISNKRIEKPFDADKLREMIQTFVAS